MYGANDIIVTTTITIDNMNCYNCNSHHYRVIYHTLKPLYQNIDLKMQNASNLAEIQFRGYARVCNTLHISVREIASVRGGAPNEKFNQFESFFKVEGGMWP